MSERSPPSERSGKDRWRIAAMVLVLTAFATFVALSYLLPQFEGLSYSLADGLVRSVKWNLSGPGQDGLYSVSMEVFVRNDTNQDIPSLRIYMWWANSPSNKIRLREVSRLAAGNSLTLSSELQRVSKDALPISISFDGPPGASEIRPIQVCGPATMGL